MKKFEYKAEFGISYEDYLHQIEEEEEERLIMESIENQKWEKAMKKKEVEEIYLQEFAIEHHKQWEEEIERYFDQLEHDRIDNFLCSLTSEEVDKLFGREEKETYIELMNEVTEEEIEIMIMEEEDEKEHWYSMDSTNRSVGGYWTYNREYENYLYIESQTEEYITSGTYTQIVMGN